MSDEKTVEQVNATVRHVQSDAPVERGSVAMHVGTCLLYDDSPSVLLTLRQTGRLVETSMTVTEARKLARMLLQRAENVEGKESHLG